jgi:uncharacterized membrane protein
MSASSSEEPRLSAPYLLSMPGAILALSVVHSTFAATDASSFRVILLADLLISAALLGAPALSIYTGTLIHRATGRDWLAWCGGLAVLVLGLSVLQITLQSMPDVHARLLLYAFPGR